ncbi:MAG: WecB/TagA/CpsF family glycosyltransferase [Alphaproteobacteria bacterium]|nr:WecB/TagA/CpsF family glycosyltransferase [Alphaproteobacteria bacterium]
MNVASTHPILATRDILGVPVLAATAGEAVAAIEARLARGERIKLAFLNAHTSNLAAADDGFRTLLGDFTVLNDGVGVDLASRVLHGERFPENLNGTDFTPRLLAESKRPLRLFLLGARPGVADEAAAALLRLAPQHTIAGTRHGYFAPSEATAVAAEIAAAKPDVLLVALGNPGQERFIQAQFDRLGVPLAIGVGALFDFLAGRVSRAPGWVRGLRAEWLYRLWREPKRLWRRYVLGNFKFISRLLWARAARRRMPASAPLA